jgi:class 3 adenylate cyclase
MADSRRWVLPLAVTLIPAALLAGLALKRAPRVSLSLQELRLDGLRVTFDSAGGFLEPLPMADATVLADIGRTFDSVAVVLESGEHFVLPEAQELTLRPVRDGGSAATLQLSSMTIPADSALEIQTEDDGTHRLFLPGGDPRELTLGGAWWVDSTRVDFGTIGIGRIVINTRDPIQVDLRVDESRGRTPILEDADIKSLYLSRLRPLSERAETTVRGGRIVGDGTEEVLDPASSPSFSSFRGVIDSLWVEDGSLRAEMHGNDVAGLSIAGEDRMPRMLATLPRLEREVLLGALLGSVALGVVWMVGPTLRSKPRAPGSRFEPSPSATGPSRRLAAVWFADIVGFTHLSSRDEDGALALSRELERFARAEVETHGGRIVKLLGDGVLTEFGSVNAAVRAALGLQSSFSDSGVVREKGGKLRIGVHVCEVVASPDGDVYGSGVNIASRIESAAEPGRVAVSENVAHQLRQRAEFSLVAMPPVQLKGLDDPTQLFVVDWSAT